MSEERFVRNLLEQHPALAASAVYVIASAVGMLFSWEYLLRFGVNVFDFAQVGDFLIASLREPLTWLVFAFALLLVAIDNAMSRRWSRKPRSRWTCWYGSPRYRRYNYLVAVLLVAVFIDAYANLKARQTLAGEGDIVEVTLGESQRQRRALLLYTTGQYLFLFDPQSRQVDIHPIESVESLVLIAPAG